jgi:beta-lactamase superfamily II metal-dependent hydrolase
VRSVLRAHGIPVQGPDPDTLTIDGVSVIVVPRDPTNDANENNNTVPIRLEFGAFSMLFAGDAEVAERNWPPTGET